MEIKIGAKTLSIIIVLIIIGIVAWSVSGYFVKDGNDLSYLDEFAKCLSEKSILFVSTGCPACAKQKEIFGSSVEHLNMIDCRTNPNKCTENNILRVPTWIINGEQKTGVQSLETLSSLTGCLLS